jgi:hypothetical protein
MSPQLAVVTPAADLGLFAALCFPVRISFIPCTLLSNTMHSRKIPTTTHLNDDVVVPASDWSMLWLREGHTRDGVPM